MITEAEKKELKKQWTKFAKANGLKGHNTYDITKYSYTREAYDGKIVTSSTYTSGHLTPEEIKAQKWNDDIIDITELEHTTKKEPFSTYTLSVTGKQMQRGQLTFNGPASKSALLKKFMEIQTAFKASFVRIEQTTYDTRIRFVKIEDISGIYG